MKNTVTWLYDLMLLKMMAFTISMVLMFIMQDHSNAQEGPQVALAGKLDIKSGRLIDNALIEIENGIIRNTTEEADRNAHDDLIDLSGYAVLPGLIDTHTHLCDNSFMGKAFDHWTYPAAPSALWAP